MKRKGKISVIYKIETNITKCGCKTNLQGSDNASKKVIDKVIRPDQTAYIPGRFIGESIRLVSDILEYTEVEQMEGYMFAADIEKAFDSVDHNFLIAVFKKFGLGHAFIQWVKTLLYDQQSCVMNNGHSTGYFVLKQGSRQGDPCQVFYFYHQLRCF